MSNLKYAAVAVLVALATGYGIGRHLQPPKVEEKVVTRTVEKRDIQVVTKVITKTDGTTETTTIETDKTVITDDKKSETKMQSQLYKVEAIAAYKSGDILYGASVSKKFIGDISVGAFALTNGTIGLTTGVSF